MMVIKRLNASMIQFLSYRKRLLIYSVYPKIITLAEREVKIPKTVIFTCKNRLINKGVVG
jgi:hypothetical protein